MIAAMLIQPGSVHAASTVISVYSDKTEAAPGDVINFSIEIGPVSDMGTLQMVLAISDGLTYVDDSGALADGLKQTLGYDYIDFTEVSKMVNGVASKADYSSEDATLICTFQCKVNEGFQGTAEVGLTELEFYSCQTWADHTSEYSVQPAVITVVGGATEEETTEAPTTAPEETTEEATEEVTQPVETTQEAETTAPEETTESVEPATPEETTQAPEPTKPSEADTSEAEQTSAPAPSSEDVKPTETTTEQPVGTTESSDPEPSKESQSSSEATESGEDATEEVSTDETKEEEGSTAPENTDPTDSNEAAVTTEEQSSAGTESTASEADTKDNTDKSGTKPAESDKDKNDPNGEKGSAQKGGWIWLAAAVLAIGAGIFCLIFFARRGRAEKTAEAERGRSRKKAK